MKLTDWIKAQAKKAGLPDTDANIKALLDNAAIADVEIANETANVIDTNLLSAAAAENNPVLREKLRKVFVAETYNGLDAEINSTMDELGLTDDVKAVILAEKSSTKRASLLAKKVKEIEAATNKDSGATDKKELANKINELNTTISKMQREHETALKVKDNEIADKLLQKDIDTDLSGFNYIFPKETPHGTKLAAARASINAKLSAKGLKVVIDEYGNKKLIHIKEGTDYFDEQNKAVSYQDFISGALAQDNLLMVSDPNKPEQKNTAPPNVNGNKSTVNQNFIGQADADMQNLEAALKLNPV